MAAYAALVSLENVVDNLRLHCRPPITLHKEQAHLLTQKLTFLQEFLHLYNPDLDYSQEADPLESRIACAAYAAQDAIESHIFDQLNNNNGEKMSSGGLYEALEKVIGDMALIKKDAMEINKEIQLHTKPTTPADSSASTSSSSIENIESTMVGADDLLLELKDKLTSNRHDLQTIPIVGKTTLALNIYQDRLIIEEHFDIRAWATISQEHNIPEILKHILKQLNKESSEGELGDTLYLYGRRFMIILDDMWSIEAWDGVKRSLPDNKNGSRIVVTTRLITLASTLPNSNSLGMKLLDENDSWDLFSKTVFGEKGCCPSEFEKIGKKIGKSCKGLPLSIIVVGGLLTKSEQTTAFWEHVEGNLTAMVNLGDGERCLRTLYMSYKHLPVHLKPCFLYMGIYHEDHVIRISWLVKLWVAEGFLKHVKGKRQEDVARMYIKDLIDRNLIMIHKLGSIGSIKECKVHDLLRDLCLREARNEGFYTIFPGHKTGNRVSRIVMYGTVPGIEEIDASSSAPLARSLILDDIYDERAPPHLLRMLRIIGSYAFASNTFIENVHQLVNSRFFTCTVRGTEFPSVIWQFWNLQTLNVDRSGLESTIMPTDIWHMSHVRHIFIYHLYLPDPPPNVQANDIVLSNLQSLGRVGNFTCSEQVVKRIPNIRKLRLSYKDGVDERFRLTDLDCLGKLESLSFYVRGSKMCRINYPESLKKLTLEVQECQCWQDILDKVGELPHLQKFRLIHGSFQEGKWETTEGQFRSLKFLSLRWCKGLKVWTTEASHFPRLEQLRLYKILDLEEVPSNLANISTLTLIDLAYCSDIVVESARGMLEEQEALYGEEETSLRVNVKLSWNNNEPPESFKSRNFHVTRWHVV